MAKTTLNLRVESDLKKEAEKVIKRLGISMSNAIVFYLNALVRENGIPFDIKANDKTKRKAKRSVTQKNAVKAPNRNIVKDGNKESEIPSADLIKAALSKL